MSDTHRARGRAGFSLVELLTAIVVIGILSGIASPYLRGAVHRADSRKIVSDVAAIRVAVLEFREAHDTLPPTSSWGEVPEELKPFLNNVDFRYKELDYRLRTTGGRGRVDVLVRYAEGDEIGDALRTFDRSGADSGSITWASTQTRFRLLENGQ